jgi:hypothetical protein
LALWPSVLAGRAFDSYLTVSISGANDLTLTTDQAVAREIVFSGALTGAVNAVFPVTATDAGAFWMIHNATSGAYTLTVKAATGGTVAVTQGKRCLVLWTGVDFVPYLNDVAAMGAAASAANSDITSLAAISGGVTMYGGLNVGDAVKGNSAQSKPFQLGRLSKSVAGSINVTLAANEYVNPILELTGALGADISVIVPLTAGATWIVLDSHTGGHTITLIGATGTGVALTATKRQICYADGTNVVAVTAAN